MTLRSQPSVRAASRMVTYGSRCRTCSAFDATPALLASSVTPRRQLQAACSVLRSYSVWGTTTPGTTTAGSLANCIAQGVVTMIAATLALRALASAIPYCVARQRELGTVDGQEDALVHVHSLLRSPRH